MAKRTWVLFAVFLMVAGLAAASSAPQFFVFYDWSKGLNSHVSAYNTPDNQSQVATNVRINDRYSALSKSEAAKSYGDTGDAAVNSLHRYYKSDNTAYVIAATSTKLMVGNDDTGAFTTIKTGLTDGKRWNFTTYKDICIGMNGYDNAQKFDGYTYIPINTTGARATDEACAELGAPFASQAAATELDAEAWYQYKIAYYDGSAYAYCTARSNPIETGTANNRGVSLTDIPIGPEGTTHRYIYRTAGNATKVAALADTTYYLVADIADNETQTFSDVMGDTEASTHPGPTWAEVSAGTNITPPKGALSELHSERLFIAGNTTYPSDLYWSDEYNPDYFPPEYVVQIRPDDGDKITMLKTLLGLLTVGKTNSMQKYYTEGSPEEDWYVSDVFSNIGCPAPYTPAVTPIGIVYLGRHGLYKFDGQSSQLISDAATAQIEDISQINIADCAGHYHNNEYHLAYTSDASGSSYNNRDLVYDLIRDAYVLDTRSINCFASFSGGADTGALYSGSSTSDGVVFAHSNTSSLKVIRYKSEIALGTDSSTSVSGSEGSPILSTYSIDNMEDYLTDAEAQAEWATSETTEKMPPDLGDGSDGALTASSDDTWSESKDYTSVSVDAGITITVSGNVYIKCLGTFTNNGTINISSGSTLYIWAFAINNTATGEINGNSYVQCNTLTNNGAMENDVVLTATSHVYNGGSDGTLGWDNDSGTSQYTTATGTGTISGQMTATHYIAESTIIKVTYEIQALASAGGTTPAVSATCTIILKDSAGATITSWTDNQSAATYTVASLNATQTGSWGSVAQVYASCSSGESSPGGPVAHSYYITEVHAFAAPHCAYQHSSGTVPTSESITDFVNALEVFTEDTVINEASASMKVLCAGDSDVLNDTITKTVSATDFSGAAFDSILVDVYALRSGTTFQMGIGEAAMTEQLVGVPVSASNTWETVELDYSGVAAGDRDAITKIGFKFTDTDAFNIVYIDNIRPKVSSGTWTSPVYDMSAQAFDKLYWNEVLGSYGNITFQARTGDTTPVDGTWSAWSAAYTNPNGSDVSGLTAARYLQVKVNFTNTDTDYAAPYLYQTEGYVFKLAYSKIGALYESTLPSEWQSGWKDFKVSGYKKLIKRIRIHYRGTEGTLNFNYKNDEGDIDYSFNIDLSADPDDASDDEYTGKGEDKIYTYLSPVNSETQPSPVGQYWNFKITENGTAEWSIQRIEVEYQVEELY